VSQQVRETLKMCTVDVGRVPAEVIAEGIRSIESRKRGDFAASDILIAARSLIRLMGRPQVLRRRIGMITAPVLLLHGAKDRLVSLRVAEASAKAFPAWRFEVAADVGHVPMLEAPEWTAEQILDWLEKDAKLLPS
jgi:pimeloyl-ACP methyl ester carboxylesterase